MYVSYLSIDSIMVCRPQHKLPLSEQYDQVHCTQFNAHILKKMMGIEAINYVPDSKQHTFIRSFQEGNKQIPDQQLHSANTGARRSVFGTSIERELARKHRLNSLGMSNSNRCVSLFKQLDMIKRARSEQASYCLHTGEAAFSKEMRVTRGLAIQGDSCCSLSLRRTTRPHIVLESVAMLYASEFYRGIWCQPDEIKAYESGYRQRMHQVIGQALSRANLHLNQVDCLLPHNINSKSWDFLRQSLDVEESRFFAENIRTEGHCFCNDFVINLSDWLSRDSVAGATVRSDDERPKIVLAVAAGAGGMFGACVLRIVDLEGFRNERHFI